MVEIAFLIAPTTAQATTTLIPIMVPFPTTEATAKGQLAATDFSTNMNSLFPP